VYSLALNYKKKKSPKVIIAYSYSPNTYISVYADNSLSAIFGDLCPRVYRVSGRKYICININGAKQEDFILNLTRTCTVEHIKNKMLI